MKQKQGELFPGFALPHPLKETPLHWKPGECGPDLRYWEFRAMMVTQKAEKAGHKPEDILQIEFYCGPNASDPNISSGTIVLKTGQRVEI